jgi:signal transduction histidine kinase/DNA-binding NarL/FixJ family response regulator
MFVRRFVRCALPLAATALAGATHLVAAADEGRAATVAPATAAPGAPFAGELGLPLQRLFSSDDYDGFSRVTAVAHTAEGFTVFGTYHAAILFDGVTYEKIPVPATYVTALCRDHDGVLWAGGDNELGVIAADPADGQLRYATHTNLLPPAARTFGRLRGMVASRAGIFAATSNGVLHLTGNRADFLPLPPASRPRLFAVGGRVYLQDVRRGLLVHGADGFRPVDTGRDLVGRELELVERDATHALCLIDGEGVFTLSLATGRLEALATPLAPLLTGPLVRGLRLPDGRTVFVRGDNRGVVIADSTLQGAQALDARTGLANTAILDAALDADRGLWLATANGLLRLDLGPGLSVFDERNAFPIGSSGSLVRHDGVLYAGSTQGLRRLVPGDPVTGRPARFQPDPRVPEICDNLRDTPAGLLFSTNQTVELLTPAGRRRLFEPAAKITMIKANRRAPGLYFIATDDGGFHVLDLATGTTRRVLSLPPGVILWNGAEESDTVSWFGTAASGFWRVAAADADWSAAAAEPHPLGRAGLPAGKSWTGVFALFDELHFLTETGMYRRDPAGGTFALDSRYRIEGVEPLRFMPVVADSAGRAWTSPWLGTVTCARPLGYFEARGPAAFTWHDAPARWQAGVGRFGAGLILVETEGARTVLWTKSPTSIARIELDTLPANRPAASWQPVLRRFTVGERSWPVATNTTLHLPFSNQPLTLRYAAPRYQPGGAIRYQTRLLGFREQWSAPSPSTETVFTNLTGGPFAFEVRAIDADGFASETARVFFSVAPPWHRSGPAVVLYVAALTGAVVGFVRWRLRQAERERLRLEQLVTQRTEELRHAKDAADAANRAKSAFLANMSHELRTPLNGVIGYAQVLMKDRELSTRNRERVQIVQTSGEHLLRMINEVLDLSKIEAGRMELSPVAFHLPQLLRDSAAAISTRLEQKQLEFAFEPAPDLPEFVHGDPVKLRQVIDNLLSNAVKFTAQGRIRLQAAISDPAAGLVRFAVSDTGVGIGETDRAKLFQPFHQATEGRPPEPGTGLGLAISQRMVALMGGTLAVESTPGAGSTFSFAVRLPAAAAGAAAATPPAARLTGYRGPRRRVLVVDDVATNRDVLRELLAPLDFVITEAATGAEALAATREARPDLVLLDLQMPGMNGFELARALRREADGAPLKLIAMSASVLSLKRQDAFDAGCDDFLAKPFREDDLLARLGRLLALEWVSEAPEPVRPSRSPFGVTTTRLSPAELEELLACARRGEITQLRRRLAAHPGDPLAATIEGLARNYRMAQIRELLAQQVARAGAASGPPAGG